MAATGSSVTAFSIPELRAQRGAKWHPPEATYLAWLDLSALPLAPTAQQWLAGAGPGRPQPR